MMKTIKETLEMALEALEYIHEGANNQGTHTGISWRCVSNKAEPVITDLREALSSEALDKMAENARELGLGYEPSAGTQVSKVWWDGERLRAKRIPFVEFYKPATSQYGSPELQAMIVALAMEKNAAEQPAQQEPVARVLSQREMAEAAKRYTSPPVSQPAPRTWVGLTIEDKKEYIAQDFGGSRTDAMDWTEKRLMEKNSD